MGLFFGDYVRKGPFLYQQNKRLYRQKDPLAFYTNLVWVSEESQPKHHILKVHNNCQSIAQKWRRGNWAYPGCECWRCCSKTQISGCDGIKTFGLSIVLECFGGSTLVRFEHPTPFFPLALSHFSSEKLQFQGVGCLLSFDQPGQH